MHLPVINLSRTAQFLFLISHIYSAMCVTQDDIDYMGTHMEVRVDVLDNLINELKHFKAQITLTNVGTEVIKKGNWAMYFCFIRHIERPEEDLPEEWDYERYGVNITHVSGCQHKLEPLAEFRDISPNGKTKIIFLGVNWQVSRTDWMPNWYVTSDGLTPRTISSTTGEDLAFVGDHDTAAKWKRYDYVTEDGVMVADRYDPFSPRMRYEFNDISDLGEPPNRIIPTPAYIQVNDKKWVYLGTHDWLIVVEQGNQSLESAAKFLSGKTGISMASEAPDFRYIRFFVGNPDVRVKNKQMNSSDSYELRVDNGRQSVTIMASTPVGAFYGVQSLLALMNEDWEIPVVVIKDAPRFEYRGMHLDVSRNFHQKEYVFKLLDIMAMYKLNKFYFHLTDDEGWRLEIPGLEELTQVGSNRCHDPDNTMCILPQLGSGPTKQSSGSGYFTVEEYRDILRYAAERHIEVIPEFDMPGHGHAAIKSMQKRYSYFMGLGNTTAAAEFLLTDLDDPSNYESIQMFKDNAINPCMESTYNFVNHLVRTVVSIHQDVNPLKIFNFGGDEVAKGAWENSTFCQDLMERLKNLEDAKDLKEYMVRRLSNISASHGLDMGAWEDGLMGRDNTPYDMNQLKNKNVYGYAWDNVWEWGASNRAYKLANANFKVVMSHATHLYFDHPYEPDPEERGYYWAPRFTDTRKTFGYMPDDVYANADWTRSGDPITEEDLCQEVKGVNPCNPLEKPENVAGIQGQLWSETQRTPEEVDYMIFPRFLALVERAWHKSDWEDEDDVNKRKDMRNGDWENFANTLGYRELKRLDDLGVGYRVPQPGAKVIDGKMYTNVAFPGLSVEYSTDGGDTWCSETGVPIAGKVLVRTRSADGGRTSRIQTMMIPATASKSSTLFQSLILFISAILLSCVRRV